MRLPGAGAVPTAARRYLRWLGLAALLAAAALGVARLRTVEVGDLNLLLITLDTTRADRLGPYGSTTVRTPNLDRLAREGVVFENAWTVAPLTLPAHASLFTGLRPPRHGVRENVGFTLADSQVTLAERLRRHGFDTAGFAASVVLDDTTGINQGFDYYVADFRTGPGAQAFPEGRRRRADAVVGEALTWWRAMRPTRFFAWVHFYDAHAPYEPPEPFRSQYADRPYDGAVAFVDQEIGALLAFLEQQGVLDRTIVAVVGDHGEGLGDHGEEQHGLFLYESVIRVPLIIRAPVRRTAGRRVSALARITDVMPTLHELLGLDPPTDTDGVSLVGPMAGRGDGPELEGYAENTYPRTRFGWGDLRAFRQGRYKLIATTRPELYDLERDPDERRNLFSERTRQAQSMLARLAALDTPGAPTAPSTPASRADRARHEQLASLGYVGSSVPAGAETRQSVLPDPKDKVEEFNRRTMRR